MSKLTLLLLLVVTGSCAASPPITKQQLQDQAAGVCGAHDIVDIDAPLARNEGVIQAYKDTKKENPNMTDYTGLLDGGCIANTVKQYNSKASYYAELKK